MHPCMSRAAQGLHVLLRREWRWHHGGSDCHCSALVQDEMAKKENQERKMYLHVFVFVGATRCVMFFFLFALLHADTLDCLPSLSPLSYYKGLCTFTIRS
jgi:hypothetical protein